LARKVNAFKTPGHLLLFGTLTEAVPTLHAKGYYPVRETTIAANLFNGDAAFSGDLG